MILSEIQQAEKLYAEGKFIEEIGLLLGAPASLVKIWLETKDKWWLRGDFKTKEEHGKT